MIQGNQRGHCSHRRAFLAFMVAAAPISTVTATAAPAVRSSRRAAPPITSLGRIDVHAHFVPDSYREALASSGHAGRERSPALPRWSAADALATMDANGIDAAILSISSPGVHLGDAAAARRLARAVNDEAARLADRHSGRFGFFATLPLPDVPSALAELEYAFDHLNADGAVILTNHQGIYPGDERLAPLFDELNRRGAIVFMHPTVTACPGCSRLALDYPPAMLEFMFETTRAVTNLVLTGALQRWPDIRIIVPHAGAAIPALIDRVSSIVRWMPSLSTIQPDQIVTTLRRLYYDLAGAALPRLLPALKTIAEPDHLLYGSDWPFTPIEAVRGFGAELEETPLLDARERRALFHGNARRLFRRLGSNAPHEDR